MDLFASFERAPLLNAGEVVQKTWTVQAMIGSGIQGQIFTATDSASQESNFAIKILRRHSQDVLQKEFDTYNTMRARLPGNHFPRPYFCGTHRKMPVMVMDLLGNSMHKALTATSPPSPIFILRWIRQLLKQFSVLHAIGLVHQDVHFDNILIGRPGTEYSESAFLIDFGMVCKFLKKDGSHVHTRNVGRKWDLSTLFCRLDEYVMRIGIKQPNCEEIDGIREKLQCAIQVLESQRDHRKPDYDQIIRIFMKNCARK